MNDVCLYVRMWVGSEQHQNLYSCASTTSTEFSPAIFPLAVIMRVFNTSSGVVRAAVKEPAAMPTSRFSKGLRKRTVIIALRMHCVCMIDIYIQISKIYVHICLYIHTYKHQLHIYIIHTYIHIYPRSQCMYVQCLHASSEAQRHIYSNSTETIYIHTYIQKEPQLPECDKATVPLLRQLITGQLDRPERNISSDLADIAYKYIHSIALIYMSIHTYTYIFTIKVLQFRYKYAYIHKLNVIHTYMNLMSYIHTLLCVTFIERGNS